MNARFPDHDTIHTALSLATRAPSIHNSQPWRWRVGTQSLHLYSDPDQHLPNTDPDSRDLLLSCGASLNHAVVALAALGWQAKVHRLPNPAEPEHLAAIRRCCRPSSTGILIAVQDSTPAHDEHAAHICPLLIGSRNVLAARHRSGQNTNDRLHQQAFLATTTTCRSQTSWRMPTTSDVVVDSFMWRTLLSHFRGES